MAEVPIYTPTQLARDVLAALARYDDEERLRFFELVLARFCRGCGVARPCPRVNSRCEG